MEALALPIILALVAIVLFTYRKTVRRHAEATEIAADAYAAGMALNARIKRNKINNKAFEFATSDEVCAWDDKSADAFIYQGKIKPVEETK